MYAIVSDTAAKNFNGFTISEVTVPISKRFELNV